MIDKFEESNGDVLELVVDRTHDGLDGAFNSLHAGLQRARVVLGVAVQPREAHQGVQRRHLHEFQVFQPLFFLAVSLPQSQVKDNKQKTNNHIRNQVNRHH